MTAFCDKLPLRAASTALTRSQIMARVDCAESPSSGSKPRLAACSRSRSASVRAWDRSSVWPTLPLTAASVSLIGRPICLRVSDPYSRAEQWHDEPDHTSNVSGAQSYSLWVSAYTFADPWLWRLPLRSDYSLSSPGLRNQPARDPRDAASFTDQLSACRLA